jgi:hypothetical protein
MSTVTEVVVAQSAVVELATVNNTNQANLSSGQQTRLKLESLVVEHDNWRDNAYKSSNEQLYMMLLKCYALYNSMTGKDESAKEMRKAVNDFANSKGYKFKASTHTITKIVKCVFGVDRRRTSTYSLVLRAAIKQGVMNKDLIAFIGKGGGVEEIRLGSTGKGLTTKQKAQVAATTVVVNNLGTATGQALADMLDAGKIGENKVFIGAWQADGTVVIRAAIESETLLNAALARHYATVQAKAKAKAKEDEEALLARLKKQAADAAAATATLIA